MVLPTARGWEVRGERREEGWKEGRKKGNNQEEEGRMMKERWNKGEKRQRKKYAT